MLTFIMKSWILYNRKAFSLICVTTYVASLFENGRMVSGEHKITVPIKMK